MHASYLLMTYLPRGAIPRLDRTCEQTGARKRWLTRPALAAPLLSSETLQLVKDAIVFAITAHSDARVALCLDVDGHETRRVDLHANAFDLELLESWLRAFEALVGAAPPPPGD